MKNSNPVIEAHKHSSDHREQILTSESCGCFYCISIYTPNEIVEWVDDDKCDICPKCSIDSVIGSRSGFPINEDFLKQMHRHWFLS